MNLRDFGLSVLPTMACLAAFVAAAPARGEETWNLAVSGKVSGRMQGPAGAVTTNTSATGSVTVVADAAGNYAGAGDMSVNMIFSMPPVPGISFSPLAGQGQFGVKGRRDGPNLIFGIETGNIICKGTLTVSTPAGTQVTPLEVPFDPSVFSPLENTVIARKEGATTSQKVNVTGIGSDVTGSADFTLSGGTGVVADRPFLKGKFPAKENRWTLELACDFTMEVHNAQLDMTTTTSIRGQAEFPLPLGDGQAKGAGAFFMKCSGVSTQPAASASNWTADGELILDGRIEKGVLKFLPRGKIGKVFGSGGSPLPFSAGGDFGQGLWLLTSNELVSIPVKDGAEVVQQITQPVEANTKGQLTWRLRGEKRELWRITVDGRDRVSAGAQPFAVKRPKSLPKTDPNAPDVKWTDAAFGLNVVWSVVIDVEIEDGEYQQGNCTASLVSAAPYAEPEGVYNVKAISSSITEADGSKHTTPYVRHPAFPVRRGVKGGRQLDLDLFFPKSDGDLGCWVAYRAILNEQEAAKKIAFWNDPKSPNKTRLRRDVTDKNFVYFPPHIAVLLVDGWKKTDGEAASAQSETYTVRRLE
jgi:hypothetical protein